MIIQEETICAIVTPPGTGGISVIRLSGRESIEITSRIFQVKSGKPLKGAESHTIHYGFISDPSTSEKIDEVLVSIMRTPHSFTCEDIIEINCHGGPFVTSRVLELCHREGARLAEPGEFTKRAFLNGRIDLTQAEGVIDLIRARTEEEATCAMWQIEGSLSNNIKELYDITSEAMTMLEAYIDFPEDDVPVAIEDIKKRVQGIIQRIDKLIEGYYQWRPFREGILTAIAGRTNVGKSSLLNILTGEERAIVTPLPGTTRDIIEGIVNIHGILLRLMDTAGLRLAADIAEEEGIKRMIRSIEASELILLVLDGSSPLTDEDREILRRTTGRQRIIVINKRDQGIVLTEEPAIGDSPVVYTSILRGEGIEDLKKAIYHLITGRDPGASQTQMYKSMVSNLRHKSALEDASRELFRFLDAASHDLPLEILALHLRKAADHLGEITGKVTTEDILERIFSQFCIGK